MSKTKQTDPTLTLEEALELQIKPIPYPPNPLDSRVEVKKETPKNIYQKLHAIMEAIAFIEKDKRNEFHKYNYASEEAIKKAVHSQLVANRVIFLVDVEDFKRVDYITKKQERSTLTEVYINYSFTDIDTLEKITGRFVGTGDDNADKGTYKAITGAIKYILTSTFLIPTGDDPEVENKKAETEKINEKLVVKIEPKKELSEMVIKTIKESTNKEALQAYANNLKEYHTDKTFIDLVRNRLNELSGEGVK
jgi:hypothetical protein